MATESDYELNPPKRVKQASWASCWAAAFESILDATANSNKKNESELVSIYANRTGGGITPGTLGTIAKDFGFIFNIFLDKTDAVVFSDGFIMERLKKTGAILSAPKVANLGNGQPGYHAQVIWGVKYLSTSDIGTSNALISTMNPATGTYQTYPISYFTTNLPMFTCWSNK